MIKKLLKFKQLDYILSVPNDFSEDKKYPVIILLHGAGGRGRDIHIIESNPYFTDTEIHNLQAVTFAPQCFANSWFDIFEQLKEFILFAVNHNFADKNRCSIMGASMGGYATWQMAMTMPDVFAAAVPICGGGMYWNAARLVNMGIWAFHGSEDKTVLPEESIKMVDKINASGGNAKLTICHGVGHDSWHNAYKNPEVFKWMFAHTLNKTELKSDGYNNSEIYG